MFAINLLLCTSLFRSNTPPISRQENSLFSSPTHSTVPLNSIAVPQGRKKLLERNGAAFCSPSRATYLTEQDMYSISPTSAMSFLQSDDASGDSRPLSPLQLPSGQDDAINSPKNDSFQFSVGPSRCSPVAVVVGATGNSSSSNNSNTQQCPAMHSDMQGHHYPLPAPNRSCSPSLPVLSPVLPMVENPSSPRLTKDRHEVTHEPPVSPNSQSTIVSQSFVHADLHRSKLTVTSDHPFGAMDEDRVSGGMLIGNDRSSPSYSSELLRIHSNALNGPLETHAISDKNIEFTAYTSDGNGTSEPAPIGPLKTNIMSDDDNTNNASTIFINNTGNGVFHQQSQAQDIALEADTSQIVPQHLSNKNSPDFHMYSTAHSVGTASNNHCPNTDVGLATNTRTSDNLPIPVSSLSMAQTALYQHAFIETGHMKTVVATPHMVIKTEETENVPSSLASSRQFSTDSAHGGLNIPRGDSSKDMLSHAHTQRDRQAGLLEDFIDGL